MSLQRRLEFAFLMADLKLAKQLIKEGANPKTKRCFYYACSGGNREVIRYIFRKGGGKEAKETIKMFNMRIKNNDVIDKVAHYWRYF